ncbi:hypothetical protein DY000_02039267 [Brassica cretica]|uniref:Uncharacterized protein n=1 Tax=Brassica cretica TaxID=69181 RepID=A0ABQ7BBR9_BRACR|nr:hypothetical protein DY000_02039267 [Brassica cretica]
MGSVQEECRDGSSTSTPPPVDVFTANLHSSLVRSSSLPLPSTVTTLTVNTAETNAPPNSSLAQTPMDTVLSVNIVMSESNSPLAQSGSDLSMQNSAMDSPVFTTATITPDNHGSSSLSQDVTELAPTEMHGSIIHVGSSIHVNNSLLPVPPLNQLQVSSIPEVNKSPTTLSVNLDQVTEKFVPSLGSWAKPLYFKPPATPLEPTTPQDYDPAIVGNQLAALWPTLNYEILNKQQGKYPPRTLQPPVEKLPPPELKADGSLRFPWAARLSPQSRNLYRAATPTYRLDGTPGVSFPSKVLRLVDSQSIPTTAPIMESSLSNIINSEVCETLVVGPLTTTLSHCAFESPSRFTVLRDVDEVVLEPASSLSLTRGGRETKPPTKFQDMEWKTVRGRGKCGRRGRGSYH